LPLRKSARRPARILGLGLAVAGGDDLCLVPVELQRTASRRVVIGGIDQIVDRAVVGQSVQAGEIVHGRIGRQEQVQPNLQLGMAGGTPVDELLLHGGGRGVDDVKRLSSETALKFDEAAAGLQDLAAGQRVQIGRRKCAEGQVGSEVGAGCHSCTPGEKSREKQGAGRKAHAPSIDRLPPAFRKKMRPVLSKKIAATFISGSESRPAG
jgi:hypothetical protein